MLIEINLALQQYDYALKKNPLRSKIYLFFEFTCHALENLATGFGVIHAV